MPRQTCRPNQRPQLAFPANFSVLPAVSHTKRKQRPEFLAALLSDFVVGGPTQAQFPLPLPHPQGLELVQNRALRSTAPTPPDLLKAPMGRS